ncbi:GNAT family N-acetyltransferase [Ruania zhangjianzhongii]|uniref:GNAT family N-acetyltransferase n=1 Tax=Ruania zhangjianzhongii TaxID=2603206 RepID=UPI001F24EC58|nr:GNAT family N-acetyltransferase [Ruania zhangjianzhongii]
MAAAVQVLRVSDAAGLRRVHALRFEVFVDEQGVSLGDELDEKDDLPGTVHLLAVADGQDLGTARLLVDGPGRVHVTRVAVRATARGLGLGRALMDETERIALAEHPAGGQVRVELSAQEGATGFYAALGYEIGSDRYLDAGIWHHDAVKTLHR